MAQINKTISLLSYSFNGVITIDEEKKEIGYSVSSDVARNDSLRAYTRDIIILSNIRD